MKATASIGRLMRLTCAAAFVVVALQAAPARGGSDSPLPRLKPDGHWLVDEQGQRVVLKGCNLGNWLLIEPWLLALDDERIRDQHDLITTLESRFGNERAERLMDTYRANWITPREFEVVKSFGFNVVRVPFHHGLLANEERPFDLREDAFEWLDRAVEMAEQAGVYVILDMHGAPGGQSTDMPSGRIGQNKLWGNEVNQKRTAWLWQRIAERYRGRPAVVAYDLLNEPWGDFQEDVRPELVSIVDRIYRAIREVDPDTLILAAGTLRGMAFYGRPQDRGWTNVGFTEHFYPGLFSQGSPSLETHARFITYKLAAKRRIVEQLGVPYLMGEFNVVFDSAAQPELMRRYFDIYGSNGWLATMWTIRMIHPDGGVRPHNWYLATNAEPFALPDLHTASYEQIEHAFHQLGTQPLAVDEELRTALTASSSSPLRLADLPPIPPEAPATDSIQGWTSTDVAATLPGGQQRQVDDRVTIYGSGADVWADRDEFHYLHRDADDCFAVQAWLMSFDASHQFAKAGWMLRESLSPDAAHVLVHAFPDGRVMLAWRSEPGGQTQERTLSISGRPVGLGMERGRGVVWARYCDADGHWHREQVGEIPALAHGGLLGLIVSSHDEAVLAAATFQGLEDQTFPPRSHGDGPRSLLENGSFELVKDAKTAPDQPGNWDRWGHWFNREKDWTPRRDGKSVLGYHHWQIDSADNSGVYQDVTGIEPGSRCSFRVYANRDVPAAGKHGPDSVELRIESLYQGRLLTVASQTYQAKDLASGDGWSLLQTTGTIPTDKARVLIVVNPSREAPRDSAIKFDSASFCVEQK